MTPIKILKWAVHVNTIFKIMNTIEIVVSMLLNEREQPYLRVYMFDLKKALRISVLNIVKYLYRCIHF